MLNIVLNHTSLSHFKTSQYFKVNLGLVATIEKNGNRIYNDKDKFSQFYTSTYNSIIYGQGNIGNIKIYNDPYIQGDVFAVYTADFQEFIFNLDKAMIAKKGIDFYLGHILKTTEEQYDERVRLDDLKKVEDKPKGDPSKVFVNPGNVNYEDLKAYLASKKEENRL